MRRGLLAAEDTPAPLTATRVGPSILRPPPEVAVATHVTKRAIDEHTAHAGPDTEELLGELLDMVFVSADEARSGHHEVHLVFKADVLGGLHLRLEKSPEGMRATFIVEDAAARRALSEHADGIVRHLEARGFKIVAHDMEVRATASR